MTNKIRQPKILYFDIETSLMKFYGFRLGEQYVSHTQLVEGEKVDIICITYCWDKGPAMHLDYDYEEQDSSKMIQEFDKIVKEADIIIGQNSDSFDVKHINTQRMLHGLAPFPEWADCTDDTLKQVRRFFKLPCNKLDYMSALFGFGGKVKMAFQDWVNIKEKNKNGLKSFNKMIRYGKKDVIDTRKVFHKIRPYIKPKFNMATFLQDHVCVHCGSKDIHKNGTRIAGKTTYQRYHCKTHGGYAGKSPLSPSTGKVGRIGV